MRRFSPTRQNAETTTNAADLAHVRALREFLAVGRSDEVAPSEQASRPAAPPLHTARAGLSPFFVELLDSLAGQLEPLQPTLTSASAFAWMAERARSLRRMRAFLTRPRALDVASGHETFVWDLLRSPYRPRFEIVITDKRAAKAEAVMRQTLITTARRNPFVAVDRLAPILDVFSKNMILRDVMPRSVARCGRSCMWRSRAWHPPRSSARAARKISG